MRKLFLLKNLKINGKQLGILEMPSKLIGNNLQIPTEWVF